MQNQNTEHKGLFLLALDSKNRLLAETELTQKTLSFSGTSPDQNEVDFMIEELKDHVVFAHLKQEKVTLMLQSPGSAAQKTFILDLASPTTQSVSFADIRWLLIQKSSSIASVVTASSDRLTSNHVASEKSGLLESLLSWSSKAMSTKDELRTALKEFLSMIVPAASAVNGMVVLSEGKGNFKLIASHGLNLTEADAIWEKMPQNLTLEILKNEAKVILPEGLRNKTSNKTTVFFKGVKSMAGFPVVAEGKVYAIFYLCFNNILLELSPSVQTLLESASNLLGIILQRALLREDLDSLQLSLSSIDGKTADGISSSGSSQGRLMVGASESLSNVYKVISRLAPVDVPTLVLGETGTGKELVAKELHRMSKRSSKPFVPVNAAALPETLMESELFGYKKGAFSGALTDHVGLIERADGGTLFVDEIGEFSQNVQAKLLRVLQEKTVSPLGDTKNRSVDFRLVAATHRNLEEMVKSGKFREDLYYRIAGAVIKLTPLRERREDILVLASFFKKQFANKHGLDDKEWSQDCRTSLNNYSWPGNVRELENVVSRAFVMSEGNVIKGEDLGLNLASGAAGSTHNNHLDNGSNGSETFTSLNEARDLWMKNYLIAALRHHKGKRAETAKTLGIGERTLFRYIEQLNIRDV